MTNWLLERAGSGYGENRQPRKGFFTDTSICIGCKACEVACKEWNRNPVDGDYELLGSSFDNTGSLGADTWRHVAFVEQSKERIDKARESGRRLANLGMPTVGPGEETEAEPSSGGGCACGGGSCGCGGGSTAGEGIDPSVSDNRLGEEPAPGSGVHDRPGNQSGIAAGSEEGAGMPGAAAAGFNTSTTAHPDTPDFRWLMASDVCKHCTHAGCLDVCPTGALFRTEHGTVVVQDDVCNGCGTCVAGCPFGVIERRTDGGIQKRDDHAETTAGDVLPRRDEVANNRVSPQDSGLGSPIADEHTGGIPGALNYLGAKFFGRGTKPEEKSDFTVGRAAPRTNIGIAQKCTLCYDRLKDGETPACAKACPTTSIKFGERDELLAAAKARVRELHAQGMTEARLYGANSEDGVGGTGSIFLLLDEPEVYGLPPDPRVPTADLPRMAKRAGVAALGMLGAAAAAFLAGGRK
ncbi:4Fe-4S dicluster domain-containing protein [Corynebacterium otitidis]|uniref:Formate dehydrogenase, beta subunit n=1 Tax=Corynebacterium otitidis ATCC 51513 TaxID=883169 RepID=I7LBP9_9CORY|nr:4Fe-4S dicluster domain-containing protein [Corynebacterium otitidis]EJZ82067.1 hypothetical protein HMPREF9719_01003 [Corynebacterium otitidis ATCC 51513]CCI83279.1 formate dehydrogenase, beta subunit [Corynebacterium otitidis ATCC 51513]